MYRINNRHVRTRRLYVHTAGGRDEGNLNQSLDLHRRINRNLPTRYYATLAGSLQLPATLGCSSGCHGDARRT